MEYLTVTEAKARLNEVVDEAALTHEQFTITKHGHPAAVLLAAADFESLQETLYWLSQPGVLEDVRASEDAETRGDYLTEDQVRAKYGSPRRSSG